MIRVNSWQWLAYSKCGTEETFGAFVCVMVDVKVQTLFHSSTDRLLSDPELSTAESPLADKKAPGSERAAERAAAAQQNSERARLASRPSYVNMQVTIK